MRFLIVLPMLSGALLAQDIPGQNGFELTDDAIKKYLVEEDKAKRDFEDFGRRLVITLERAKAPKEEIDAVWTKILKRTDPLKRYPPLLLDAPIKIGQIGQLNSLSSPSSVERKVSQIVDDKNAIVSLRYKFFDEWHSTSFWITNTNTDGLVDDLRLTNTEHPYAVTGTTRYTTAGGSTKTIYVLTPLKKEHIEAIENACIAREKALADERNRQKSFEENEKLKRVKEREEKAPIYVLNDGTKIKAVTAVTSGDDVVLKDDKGKLRTVKKSDIQKIIQPEKEK